MNFDVLQEAVSLCVDSQVPVCIWGARGIGKSMMVQRIASEGKLVLDPTGEIEKGGKTYSRAKMGLVDMRASQMEASDLRGLPDRVNGKTVYLPPYEMPQGDLDEDEIQDIIDKAPDWEKDAVRLRMQPRFKHGILFLDEINRASDDVLQATFQLLRDRSVGQYRMPSGWSVVMACNYMSGNYIVNGFTDSAFLDRMAHLHMYVTDQSLVDWSKYMVQTHGDAAVNIIEFCSTNLDNLTGKTKDEYDIVIHPSPRSWDAVAKVTKVSIANGYSRSAEDMVVAGLVGESLKAAWRDYSCPVKPLDILQAGPKQHKKQLGELSRGNILGLSMGILSYMHASDKYRTDKPIDHCLQFAHVLLESPAIPDKDIVVAFVRGLLGVFDPEGQSTCFITNRDMAKIAVEKMAHEMPIVLVKLVKQFPDLHALLSEFGWGKAA